QAEDGIRDFHVTGVQTCALPLISLSLLRCHFCRHLLSVKVHATHLHIAVPSTILHALLNVKAIHPITKLRLVVRSRSVIHLTGETHSQLHITVAVLLLSSSGLVP